MTGWTVSTEPSTKFKSWAASAPRAFATLDWSRAMAAAGASPLFAWHGARSEGVIVAAFRRGPFRIGVMGQPVPGPEWDRRNRTGVIADARALGAASGLDVVRINRSMQPDMPSGSTAARPERWIADLATWRPEADARRRRDLAFARRAGGGNNHVEPGIRAAEAHALCEAAVNRHGGVFRYTPEYFAVLAQIHQGNGTIRCWSALDADGGLLGVAVVAIHQRCAYYLHGGASNRGRRAGVADLLLETLASNAASAGCTHLTLMASPWEQPGLIAFKKKWAPESGYCVTEDVACTVAGRALKAALRWRSRGDRAYASRSSATAP